MTAIPGTNVADVIVPFDTNDTFATHDEKYGKGGSRSVQSLVDRDAIPSDRRARGMSVRVLDNDQIYYLKDGISNGDWKVFTAQASGNALSINGVNPNSNNQITLIGSTNVDIIPNPSGNSITISAGNLITALKDLTDVMLVNVLPGQTLITDGSMWYNADAPSISGNRGLFGTLALNTTDTVYSIAHTEIPAISAAYPVISLQTPSSTDPLLVIGITNRSVTSFDIVLSQPPTINGYYINWSMGGGNISSINVKSTFESTLKEGYGISVIESPINTFTIAVTGNFGDSTLRSEVAAITADLQYQIDNNLVHTYGNETISGVKTFEDNVVIHGNLNVLGDQFLVHTETVSASNNTIIINGGEGGPGVTKGYAGIVVDRGQTTSPYVLFYEELRQAFTVGASGDTQVVATREDTPIADGIAVWNNTQKRFDTIPNTTYATNASVANISAGVVLVNGDQHVNDHKNFDNITFGKNHLLTDLAHFNPTELSDGWIGYISSTTAYPTGANTNGIIPPITGGQSFHVISDDRGYIYVSSKSNDKLIRINPINKTTTIYDMPTTGYESNTMVYCPLNQSVYITNDVNRATNISNGLVRQFNVETEQFVGSFTIPKTTSNVNDNIRGMCFCPSNGYLYVAYDSLIGPGTPEPYVYVINPIDNSYITRIGPLANRPWSVSYIPSIDKLYVGHIVSAGIEVIDPYTNAVTSTISGASIQFVQHTVECPKNNLVYGVTSNLFTDRRIVIIDPLTGTHVDTILPTSVSTNVRTLQTIFWNPRTERLYAFAYSNNGLPGILVINPISNKIVKQIRSTASTDNYRWATFNYNTGLLYGIVYHGSTNSSDILAIS
jgi:hypothetical protein